MNYRRPSLRSARYFASPTGTSGTPTATTYGRVPRITECPSRSDRCPYDREVFGKKTAFEVDDQGVRRLVRGQIVESVDWQDLSDVSIRTTAAGPRTDDVYLLLTSTDGRGVSVPQSRPEANEVLQRVQSLPGFDNAAVVAAMGSAEDAVFQCWQA